MMLVWLGLILVVGSFVCALVLCGLVRSLALGYGFVDEPGERKIHAEPVALGGGIAVFMTVLFVVGSGFLFALFQAGGAAYSWLPAVLVKHIPRILDRADLVLYVLGGGAAMFALGLLDDLFGLPPWLRLAVQAAVAALLYLLSDELRVTAFMHSKLLSFIYTIAWIVGMTNAFNLLDNMDGLSAGVAVIASTLFFVVAVLTQQYFLAAMLLVFAGALAGFLLFNLPPAKMFLGDSGSLFVGYMLAALTTVFKFYAPGQGYSPVACMLIPIVILAVPIYDTVSVVIIRLAARRPVFQGDTNHFSHRLVALGMGRRAAVLTIYLVTLCTGLLAPLLLQPRIRIGIEATSALVAADVVLVLALIWLLERAGRRGRNPARGQSP